MIFIKIDIKDVFNSIDFLVENNIGAEISLYDTDYLSVASYTEILQMSEVLRENGIRVMTHLPMYGLNIGIKDSFIRNYSLNTILKGIDISAALGAEKAVFHNGLNPLEPINSRKKWYETVKELYSEIYHYAEQLDVEIVAENVWDNSSEFFDFIGENFPNTNICYDIGHANVYMDENFRSEFIENFGNKMSHFHIHDNNGEYDEHLHIGQGNIDFYKFFELVKKYTDNPTFTLEVKTDGDVKEDVIKLREFIKL